MPKETWIAGIVLTICAGMALLWISGCNRSREAAALRAAADLQAEHMREATHELARVRQELEESRARLAQLETEAAEVASAKRGLEAEMRAKLDSKDITISELQGKLTVNILDRVLFESGEAELKEEGRRVLLQVASVLTNFPSRQIHVLGHTDNVPIRAGAQAKYASNWELSTARAIAAVRFLQDHAGVDPRLLGAVGYGEHRPVADNASAEGRARNRRIAIVILAEEALGFEAPAGESLPVATPADPAPAPALP